METHEIERVAERALNEAITRHLNARYPAHPVVDPDEPTMLERLRDDAIDLQAWMLAFKSAIDHDDERGAWQALSELQALAAQILEDHP